MIDVEDPTALSRLYHLNSEPWLNESAYRGAPYLQERTLHPDAPRTALPPAAPGLVARLAARRRSTRRFVEREMALETLGALLCAGYGVAEIAGLESGGKFARRTAPSAGGLYPLDLYAIVRNLRGAPDGAHHFDPFGPSLEALGQPSAAAMAEAFYTWPFVEHANAVVCVAAEFLRCQKKYGPRGYRYILLEAGHVAQTLCLAAEEAGLATLCMGGFRDAALNRLLGLDPARQGVVYAVAIGWAAP